MAKTWRCGDCGSVYPRTVHYCTRPFDDYLALRGGTVESAITTAVDKAIDPLVERAEARLASRNAVTWAPSTWHWCAVKS